MKLERFLKTTVSVSVLTDLVSPNTEYYEKNEYARILLTTWGEIELAERAARSPSNEVASSEMTKIIIDS